MKGAKASSPRRATTSPARRSGEQLLRKSGGGGSKGALRLLGAPLGVVLQAERSPSALPHVVSGAVDRLCTAAFDARALHAKPDAKAVAALLDYFEQCWHKCVKYEAGELAKQAPSTLLEVLRQYVVALPDPLLPTPDSLLESVAKCATEDATKEKAMAFIASRSPANSYLLGALVCMCRRLIQGKKSTLAQMATWLASALAQAIPPGERLCRITHTLIKKGFPKQNPAHFASWASKSSLLPKNPTTDTHAFAPGGTARKAVGACGHEAELAKLHTQLAEKDSALRMAQSRAEDLQRELQQKAAGGKDSDSKYASLRASYAALESKYAALEAAHKSLEADHASLKAKHAEAVHRSEVFATQLADAQKAVRAATTAKKRGGSESGSGTESETDGKTNIKKKKKEQSYSSGAEGEDGSSDKQPVSLRSFARSSEDEEKGAHLPHSDSARLTSMTASRPKLEHRRKPSRNLQKSQQELLAKSDSQRSLLAAVGGCSPAAASPGNAAVPGSAGGTSGAVGAGRVMSGFNLLASMPNPLLVKLKPVGKR
eukprot:TRINITY_DN17649_c0_g1_i1.p1 TRINITY_DN17649_c0_g1~~TRINITY_DN17649_c0_g1_i1.p1  ORF type:complete len:544 (+),score=169.41 TRINITY_DN17649_c0_g1_i1:1-1632(+)